MVAFETWWVLSAVIFLWSDDGCNAGDGDPSCMAFSAFGLQLA
jgi:hypothetical protein